jgi:lipoate-protein ligase B
LTGDASQKAKAHSFCLTLPVMDYETVWQMQTRLVAARKAGDLASDVIMVLEHLPVFTLGRRGGRENLMVSETFLQQRRISVVQVERGGNITYHGPGQVIVYAIMDLAARRVAVVDLVTMLEEVMIRTAGLWGVAATRNPLNRGIWIESSKLGSVGIAIRKGISFHGLALNVDIDLEPFAWINPCGLQNVSVTSLEQQSGQRISMADIYEGLKEQFQAVFGFRLVPVDLKKLRRMIGDIDLG